MPDSKSFKIDSTSTASAFDPTRVETTTNTNKKVTQIPEGACPVYFNPETGEFFYLST